MANNCTVSSKIPGAGNTAVGIRSGTGSVSVSGSRALTLAVISNASGITGKAIGIEAAGGRIVIDVPERMRRRRPFARR